MSHISKPSSTFKERTRTSLNLNGYRANKSFSGPSKLPKDFSSSSSATAPRNKNEFGSIHSNFPQKLGQKGSPRWTFNNFSNTDSKSFDFTRSLPNQSEIPSSTFNFHKSFDSSRPSRNQGHSQQQLYSRTDGFDSFQNEKLYPDVSISSNNFRSTTPTYSTLNRRNEPVSTLERASASPGKFAAVSSSLPGSMPFEISKERLRSKLLNKTERTKTSLDSFIKKSTPTSTAPKYSPKTHEKLFGSSFSRFNSSFSQANKPDYSLSNIYADEETSKLSENINMRSRMNNEVDRFSQNQSNDDTKYDGLFGNSETIKQRKQEQESRLLHHNRFSSLGEAPYVNYMTNNDVVAGEEFMPEPYYENKKSSENKVIDKNKSNNNNSGILTSFVSKLSNLFNNSLNEYSEKLNNYDENDTQRYDKPQKDKSNYYNLNKKETEELNQIVRKEKKSEKARKLKKKSKKKKKKQKIESDDNSDTEIKSKAKKTSKSKESSFTTPKPPESVTSYNTGTSTAVSSKDKAEMTTKYNNSESSTKHQVRRNIFTLNRYKNLDEMKSERKTQLELLLKQKEIDMKDKEIERLNAKINVLEDSIIDVKKSILEMKMHTTNGSLNSFGITGISTPAVPVGSKRRFVGDDEDSDEYGSAGGDYEKTNVSEKMTSKRKKHNDHGIEKIPNNSEVKKSIFKIQEQDNDSEANKSAKKIVEDFKKISEKIKRREEELAKHTENTQSSYTNQYSNYDDEFDESNIDETVAQIEKSVSELSPVRIPFRV